LFKAERYAALLSRQQAGKKLDLSSVPRPGLAISGEKRLVLIQGSGRLEKLAAGQPMDLFMPDDEPIPKGVVVLQRGISGELARLANLLSSRGNAGSNPALVDLFTVGRTFVRVLAPRELIDAPLSRGWDGPASQNQ
jgi:hypothetical protein